MISIDYRDPRPIYLQIKDSLRRLILSGTLPPGTRLPSVRSLATSLTINPNTIQRAYRELEAEGCIFSIAGKGSFAADLKLPCSKEQAEAVQRLLADVQALYALGFDRERIISLIGTNSAAEAAEKE